MTFTHLKAIILLLALSLISCGQRNKKDSGGEAVPQKTEKQQLVPEDLKWSERMALSEIHRFPEAWQLDFHRKPKWSYTQGVVLKGIAALYDKTGKEVYFDYIKEFGDTMVNPKGEILTYDMAKYNIDMVNTGKILFYLYDKTGEEKYLVAIRTLREQLDAHPRTSKGGFWHKKIYPWQMWLDGLYMGQPFYAEYTGRFSEGDEAGKAWNDIALQFSEIQKHSLDEETGLLYHGWDESREQQWADRKTGTSPHFWSRALGWYAMALVDVLDYFPEDHPSRKDMVGYLNRLAAALAEYQDKESGLWYQVTDMGGKEDNYLEASGSCMFIYSLAKGVRKGYLPESYSEVARKGYQGVLDRLIEVEDNGVVNLTQVCAVAGLGGNPYRDGTYEYYVNEKIRSNDPKGTGPFIMASLELDR
ncbi:glycoside hydrolase family 88/105 protein [Sinomicrobium soli]|uniref:glycoside hydrolase family 88/105 protein n=1 Tax=Sinomicrobium sp. N-1-3-6 TaxID=2219864 RepID=UPI000DCF530C|nr:glycoside hydrolase family 88 protein [Sinomicrobium sp. N-1-3-6]RAV30396.1 glycosyl hydrolase family 88 [Sinomicrobium sp. N-1-3-6]